VSFGRGETRVTIGERIRVARQRQGVTQGQLGAQMARPRSAAAVSDLERGNTKLSITDLQDIATITGQPVSWFLQDEALFEQLAALEHIRWSDWQRYVHSCCVKLTNGSLAIPGNMVERWERLMSTPYELLSERDKQQDRNEVMRYWKLVTNEGRLT